MKRVVIFFNVFFLCCCIFGQTSKSGSGSINRNNLENIKQAVKGIWKSDLLSSDINGVIIFYDDNKLIFGSSNESMLALYTIEIYEEIYLIKVIKPKYYKKIFGNNLNTEDDANIELLFDIIDNDTIIIFNATESENIENTEFNGVIFRRSKL